MGILLSSLKKTKATGISVEILGKNFYFVKPKEEDVKQRCLQILLTIFNDPKQNPSKASSITLAIEASQCIQPYLRYKHPRCNSTNDWIQYNENCTHIRLWLLQQLFAMGHSKYINDRNRFGNTPLIFACALKEPKLIKLLLRHGATISQPYTLEPTCNCPILDEPGMNIYIRFCCEFLKCV